MVSMLALRVSRAVWVCETALGSGLVAAAQSPQLRLSPHTARRMAMLHVGFMLLV
jgi:hypothetical protein